MNITKSGIILSSNISESEGTNILLNTEKYTKPNPYVLSGSSSDIFKGTDMYGNVIPGQSYYLSCQTDSEWADGHGYSDVRKGKATIWLYLVKTFDASNTNYDKAVCFTSTGWVEKGLWKYTIPSEYNMARIRFNTYSNGETVTCKFWDVRLILEKYYIGKNGVSLHMEKNCALAGELYEI